MLEVASLGSGSRGNATIVRSGEATLLVDCGFTLRETVNRLKALQVDPSSIDALLVTHEHGDHTKGVGPFSRKFGLPVWMTCGTYNALRDKKIDNLHLFHAHDSAFKVRDIDILPFPMPHDAAESCQFVFRREKEKLVILTDLGAPTRHVMDQLADVDMLLLESNYDPEMLRTGPYPPALQSRIASNWGHLSNFQAAHLLQNLDHSRLQRVLLGHLSEKNNHSSLAKDTVASYLPDGPKRLEVLEQHQCSPWFHLD